jgi:hypothetical protein
MAEKKFFVDINLQGSALTNAKIGTNSGIGSTEGAFGYDSSAHRLQYFDGTATKEVANLSDIAAVTGGLIFQGGYDPTTNTPDIADGSALKGFFWAATAAGTFLGESVQVGDSIVAKVDNAGANIADWLILQGNIVIATDSVDGISRLATQAEADAGTETGAVVITPATLQGKIDAQITPAINDKLSKTGGTMSGTINMAGGIIENSGVVYTNNLASSLNTEILLLNDLSSAGGKITNLPAPTNNGDATNKDYVDTAASTAQANAEAYADSLAPNYDAAGSASTAESNANTYTDTGLSAKLNLAGGTMTGPIDMGYSSISNANQVSADVVTAGYILVTGIETNSIGTENNTAPLSVRSNLDLLGAAGQMKIINVPTPTNNGDAANKEYVDTTTSTAIAAQKFAGTIQPANWSLDNGVYKVTLTHNLNSYGILFSAMNLYENTFDEFSYKSLSENTVQVTSNILPTQDYLFSILKG